MCGFGGIARIGSDVDLTLLERLGEALFHRGRTRAGRTSAPAPP